MARSKTPLQIRLEYYPIRALWRLLLLLPDRWAETACYAVLKGLMFFISKRRALVDQNLAASFPQLTKGDRRRIFQESLQNLAKGITVFVRMPRWKKQPPPWLIHHDLRHIEESIARGRGTLCFTAHYACWELMAYDVMRRYRHVAIVYRELDNPRLERLVAGVRTAAGGTGIPRQHLLRQGIKFLRTNGVIGFLVDQNFAPGGVFVDFFGRLAATVPVLSVLARRTGSTIIPVHSRWIGKELHVFWEAPLALSARPELDLATAEDTAVMTKTVEKWIREDPAQWLWLHNRWKRRPREGDLIFRPFGGDGGI